MVVCVVFISVVRCGCLFKYLECGMIRVRLRLLLLLVLGVVIFRWVFIIRVSGVFRFMLRLVLMILLGVIGRGCSGDMLRGRFLDMGCYFVRWMMGLVLGMLLCECRMMLIGLGLCG